MFLVALFAACREVLVAVPSSPPQDLPPPPPYHLNPYHSESVLVSYLSAIVFGPICECSSEDLVVHISSRPCSRVQGQMQVNAHYLSELSC